MKRGAFGAGGVCREWNYACLTEVPVMGRNRENFPASGGTNTQMRGARPLRHAIVKTVGSETKTSTLRSPLVDF